MAARRSLLRSVISTINGRYSTTSFLGKADVKSPNFEGNDDHFPCLTRSLNLTVSFVDMVFIFRPRNNLIAVGGCMEDN